MDSNFKTQQNYTEQLDQTQEQVNTCQDCLFSTYNKYLANNELHCVEGNMTVSANGVCNKFISVI